jgi:hypothetical protein
MPDNSTQSRVRPQELSSWKPEEPRLVFDQFTANQFYLVAERLKTKNIPGTTRLKLVILDKYIAIRNENDELIAWISMPNPTPNHKP